MIRMKISTEERNRRRYIKEKKQRDAYQREYDKQHKEHHDAMSKKRYKKRRKQLIRDRQLRYHYDDEWREEVKKYNRERMRRIRAKEKAERIKAIENVQTDML